jgi:hypothetical protein
VKGVSRFTHHVSRITHQNGIADAHPAGADDFGEDALALVHHPRAQALANRIHLRAWLARFPACGYEGHLAYRFAFLQTVLLREPAFRARLLRSLQ